MQNKRRILITLAALALALSPNFALAQHTPFTSGHVHSVSFHDRAPRMHDHSAVAHRQ